MGIIDKGKIATINGTTCRVIPSNSPNLVSSNIVIPWHLQGSAGNLTKGTEVIFATFDDQTGILLARADGVWNASLPALTVGGINVSNHTHSVSEGSTSTGKPK